MAELAQELEDEREFFYTPPDDFDPTSSIRRGVKVTKIDQSSSAREQRGLAWDMVELRRRANGENWQAFPGLRDDDPDIVAKRHQLFDEGHEQVKLLPRNGLPAYVAASLAIRPFGYWQPKVPRPDDEPALQGLTQPVGFGYVHRMGGTPDTGAVNLANIYVAPEFRGHGVGKAMLHALLSLSPEDAVTVTEVLRSDESTHRFAQLLGFTAVPFREHVVFVGESKVMYDGPNVGNVLARLELANPWLRNRQDGSINEASGQPNSF